MKRKWKEFFRKHWVLTRFGPLFIFLIVLFFLLVGHKFFSDVVPVEKYFTIGVAHISSVALEGAGFDNRVAGTKIYNENPESPDPGFSVDLKTGCNGLIATLIFIAAILAFPASWKHKLLGMLVGILILQSFNVVRIGVLYYLGLYHKSLFDTVHVYVAQSILIAVAAALWLLWSLKAGRQPELDGG